MAKRKKMRSAKTDKERAPNIKFSNANVSYEGQPATSNYARHLNEFVFPQLLSWKEDEVRGFEGPDLGYSTRNELIDELSSVENRIAFCRGLLRNSTAKAQAVEKATPFFESTVVGIGDEVVTVVTLTPAAFRAMNECEVLQGPGEHGPFEAQKYGLVAHFDDGKEPMRLYVCVGWLQSEIFPSP